MSDRDDPVPGDASAAAPPPGVEDLVTELADQFLADLQDGKSPDRRALAASHPDLAPWLDERLRLVERLGRAGQGKAGRLQVRCPHCGQITSVAAMEKTTHAVCPSCGSSFRVDASLDGDGPQALPATIGRFQVMALLGRGSFGAVYEAFDPDLGRAVAVKVPRAGCFAAPDDEERFLREARHAAQLKHPSIVHVHEIGYEKGLPYIVSDLIEGSTLSERFAGGRPSFREAAELVAQVAEALHHAHREKIVHRDVKPQNILIDFEGRPHVTDFGLARREEGEVTITLDGQILGTPAYMPPEQAAGRLDDVDGRSDVYSLGVVLYELLAGRRPFEGSRTRVVQQVIHDEPPPPRTFNDHIPRDLETICLKAMAKERNRRYESAAALADDLRRHLRGEPIAARPVGALERGLRWCRRNPVPSSLIGAVVMLLVVTAAVSLAAYLRVEKSLADTKAAETQATRALQASRELLVRRHVGEGASRLAAGDPLTSLLWFLQAYRLDQEDPVKAAQHRMRLAAVLDRCPRIESLWFAESEGYWQASSDDRRRLLAIFMDRVMVLESATGKVLFEREDLGPFPRASLSADGKLVALSRQDRSVIIAGIDSGESLELGAADAGPVAALALSPDGKNLAVGRKDGVVEVWDLSERRRQGEPPRCESHILSLLFSPDGATLLVCTQLGVGHLWSLVRAEALGRPIKHRGSILATAFSADGQQVVTGGTDGAVKVVPFGQKGGREIEVRHADAIQDVEIREDGAYLLTASADRTARVWSLPGGEPAGPPLVHAGWVMQATFFRKEPRILTGSLSGTVHQWNPFTGKEVAPPLWHGGAVRLAAFAPAANEVITATLDGCVRVWRMPERARGLRSFPLGGPCYRASLLSDGKKLLVQLVGTQARVWDVDSGEPATPVLQLSPNSQHLGAGEDGRRIWACSSDGALRCFDGSGQVLGDSPAFGAHVGTFATSRDGQRVAMGLADGRVGVWLEGHRRHVLPHGGQLLHLQFSPDGKLLAAAANMSGEAKIWDVESGQLVRLLGQFPSTGAGGYSGRVMMVSGFSPDGRSIVTGDTGGDLKLWDRDSGTLQRSISTHQHFLHRAIFSADGKQLGTAAVDGTARVWRLDGSGAASMPMRHEQTVDAIAFSDDGRLLATGSKDRMAGLWSAQTGEPLGPPLEHDGAVTSVSFRPGAHELVTCSMDGTARVWPVKREAQATDELFLLAQLLACRAPDAHGNLEPLSAEAVKALWAQVKATGGN